MDKLFSGLWQMQSADFLDTVYLCELWHVSYIRRFINILLMTRILYLEILRKYREHRKVGTRKLSVDRSLLSRLQGFCIKERQQFNYMRIEVYLLLFYFFIFNHVLICLMSASLQLSIKTICFLYPTLTGWGAGSIIVLLDVGKLLLSSSRTGEANCAKDEGDLWSLSLQPGQCFLRIYIIVKVNVLICSYCVGASGLSSHGKILSSYISKSNCKAMFVFFWCPDC